MNIYILRHGETELNKKKILQGNSDSNLTNDAIIKAKSLNTWYKKIKFDRIISSNLKRAIDTAKLVSGEEDIIIDENISEMRFGYWQGKSKEEIFKNELEKMNYENYFFNPNLYVPVEGGETFESIVNRAKKFFDDIKKFDVNENILVVTHGAFIKALLLIVKNNDLSKFWDDPYVYNLSLTMISYDGKDFKLEKESCLNYFGE